MLRRLWVNFKRDNLINWRNGFVAITVLVALVYIVLVRWIIPGDLQSTPRLYIYDATRDQATALDAAGRDEIEFEIVESEAALREGMEQYDNSVGIALREGDPLPEVTYYFQAYHSPQVRNLMAALTEARVAELYRTSPRPAAETRVLRENAEAYDIPLNLLMVPGLLFSDPTLIGMVFIAVLLFMEKDEGTVRAYQVTPGRLWEYLLSKALTMALLAIMFALIFVTGTVGLRGPNWPALLALLALGAVLGTLLGAIVAIHFDNISQYLFPAILLMLFVSMPSIAYFVPAFSPVWLRWMPTYPLAFGLREAIFPAGNPQAIWLGLGYTLAAVLAALVLATAAVRRQMARSA